MPSAVIAGGISAIGSIGSALIGSSSAKSAAKTQAKSASDAMAVQKEMYDQTRADLSPWVSQGQAAATTLGSLMGLGGGSSGASTGAATGLSSVAGSRTPSASAVFTGKAVPRDSEPTDLPTTTGGARTSLADYYGTASPQTQAQARTSSGYVRMQAPNGEVEAIPEALAPQYEQRGAVRIQ